MKVNLLGGTAQARYLNTNSQRTINWYPVISEQTEENKNNIALFCTPGLSTYTTLPGRYGRVLFTARTHLYTKCFAVVDNVLYEIATNGTYSTIGTMADLAIGASRLTIECNLQNEIFIGGYTASYVYDMDTSTLTKVSDTDFPNNVDSVTYLDQYMIVAANGAVFESETTSALNWLVAQTYSPTFKSAPVIAVGALREQIFNFTTETIEVFINDGTSPYSRLPRTSMLVGILAKNSLATFGDGFIFLGKSRNGRAQVFFFDGWNNPTVISSTNIAWQINLSNTLDDAFGYVEQTKDGHYWYHLTIPELELTYVYDVQTKLWFIRTSTMSQAADGTINQGYYRGICHTNFNGMNLFMDRYSGTIFKEDYTVFTENSQPIRRERTSQILSEEDKYFSIDELILDCSVGTANSSEPDPSVLLSISEDGGYTFGEDQEIVLGKIGQYDYVSKLQNLGMGRRRVIKLVHTDPVDLMIQNAYIQGSVGEF